MKKYLLIFSSLVILSCAHEEAASTEEYGEAIPASESNQEIRTEGESTEETSNRFSEMTKSKALTPDTGLHKTFITASRVKFKCEDVYESVVAIENATSEAGGFITLSNVNSQTFQSRDVELGDSIATVSRYRLIGNMTLKVPQEKMPFIMESIGTQIQYLDYRHIEADDVTLDQLRDELEKELVRAHAQSLHDVQENSVDAETEDQLRVAEDVYWAKALGIGHRIEAAELADKIKYSEIELELYEPSQVWIDYRASESHLYSSPFSVGASKGLDVAHSTIKGIGIVLIAIYPLIVLSILSYVAYRIIKGRKAKKG